ncbi:cytochrome P450 [Aaosphaeria arxii CBS 175.79]|uniref:Cytochrome P450 n=1 Tax=Aaosphaeria arxii CBS 175.79 TaxID=1450172 RepID=A0A6A5Y5X5_9PLEO|nr:cytochrome P450 [Aaosphaeria arxii CBS 175.79]KAF2020437.1 cytochrome P450 [Aaosphaeria arxii CBS 175.79]
MALLVGITLQTWSTVILPIGLAVYWFLWIIYARTLHPLATVPGPFWASISRTWMMYRMYRGDQEIVQRKLHEQYGPLLRVAPHEVQSNDPAEIAKIYSTQRPLEKTDFYSVFRAVAIPSRPDMFTSINEKEHAVYRKLVSGVYSMSNILKNEDSVDGCVTLFVERLRGFADRNEAFDFGLWLEMYTYDVIGAVFFGKQFGFLQDSHDHGNYIAAVHKAMPFLSFIAQAPSYARGVLMATAIFVPPLLKAIIAVDNIRKTALRETADAMRRSQEDTFKRHDMISLLTAIVHQKGETEGFTRNEVTNEMWTAVMAGADSTAIALRAIFYYLMKHPAVMKKVHDEIDYYTALGVLGYPVKYNDAVKLPYLTAVVKEAMRIFPSFQASMQRYAPPEGVKVAGVLIPAGYRIGMNPGCVQYSREIFGHDAYVFRPERWLESEERSRFMDRALINFGAGTRTCTGKHLAMVETYKITVEILRNFDVEMAHDEPWTTQNATFVMQDNVICRFKRRQIR